MIHLGDLAAMSGLTLRELMELRSELEATTTQVQAVVRAKQAATTTPVVESSGHTSLEDSRN